MDDFTPTSLSARSQAPAQAPSTGQVRPGIRIRLNQARQSGLLRKVARFGIVGVVSSLFYVATMAALVEGLRTSATVGAIGAFCIGTAVSYIGNTVWSFEAQWNASSARRFVVVTLAGLVLNVALAYALETVGLHYLLISLVILVIVPAFNFIGHNFWTYRNAA
jgi:putative flippase GtrA